MKTRGRKSYNGTEKERVQTQVRLLKTTRQKIEDNNYYNAGNMSGFIESAVDEKIDREEGKK